MPAPLTEEELVRFHSEEFIGADPYTRRLPPNPHPDQLPFCMYYIHATLDGNSVDDIKHYYHDNGNDPILYNDTEALVKRLADNASLRDHVPPHHGSGFKNMLWRRRSYLAFVVDHPEYKVWSGKGIEFNNKDGALPNHTFFDAKDFTVNLKKPDGSTVGRTAFVCINYMIGSNGSKLPDGAREKFSFALLLRKLDFPEPFKYDPGGTNQGPPVDP
jgi:hypothetical protein